MLLGLRSRQIAGRCGGNPLDDGNAVVGRAVVYDDDLVCGPVLAKKRREGAADELCVIVIRQNYGERRHRGVTISFIPFSMGLAGWRRKQLPTAWAKGSLQPKIPGP